jgi:hypothetical protein
MDFPQASQRWKKIAHGLSRGFKAKENKPRRGLVIK